MQNADETDVDCGGSCPACSDGLACAIAGDCTSGVCDNNVCAVAACDDLVQNADETDVDCGGSCPACSDGLACAIAGDCTSGVCDNNVCAVPTCTDSVTNGDETDLDCGGATCAPCLDGFVCNLASDCTSGVCDNNLCSVPACDDLVQNADETDIDCGGATCPACLPGFACALASDCDSGVCTNAICDLPTCTDSVINGDETDIDCGGATCPACLDGFACNVADDCESGVCGSDGLCAVPTCVDGIVNGDETDTDCGGTCPACNDGLTCALATDCASGVCDNGACAVPTCSDLVQNADETDIDCGGATCPACTDGLACALASDCTSGVCDSSICAVPACDDGVLNGSETDVDCGGFACPGCAAGESCVVNTDCDSGSCGGGGTCNAGSLSLGNDSFSLPEDAIDVPLATGLNDPAGVTVTSFTTPTHGTATIINGVLHYTPQADFPDAGFVYDAMTTDPAANAVATGTDTFDYTGTDAAGNTGTATVTLTVQRSHLQPQESVYNDGRVATELGPSGKELVISRFAELPTSINRASMLGFDTAGTRIFVQAQDRGTSPLDNNGVIYELVRNPATGVVTVSTFFDVGAFFSTRPENLEGNSSFADGVRDIAFHPDFDDPASAFYGKFYLSGRISRDPALTFQSYQNAGVFVSVQSGASAPDSSVIEFRWDATTQAVDPASYREVLRIGMAVPNKHPIKSIDFNPYAIPGDPDYGKLYVINGDGAQNNQAVTIQASQNNDGIGKLLRIDPTPDPVAGKPYTVPSDNPFVGNAAWIDEIYAIGLRNEHDITFYEDANAQVHILLTGVGYDNADEINVVTPGANLGWAVREGPWVVAQNGGNTTGVSVLPSDDWMFGYTYPAAFVAHDPFGNGGIGNVGDVFQALAGGHVIVNDPSGDLYEQYIFGDFSRSSRLYHVPIADLLSAKTTLVQGETGSDLTWATPSELTILFNHDNDPTTTPVVYADFAEIVNPVRSDVRFGEGPEGELYLLNKYDGWVYIAENTTPPGFVLPPPGGSTGGPGGSGPLQAVSDAFVTDGTTTVQVFGEGSNLGLKVNDSFGNPEPPITDAQGIALAGQSSNGNPFAVVAGTFGGDFTIESNGSMLFDPAGDFSMLAAGESEVTATSYTLTDTSGATSTASAIVTVKANIADVPTIQNLVVNPSAVVPITAASAVTPAVGTLYYNDRPYTLTSFPGAFLSNGVVLPTNNDDRDITATTPYLTFDLSTDGFVYVGLDTRATSTPAWLLTSDWFDTGFVVDALAFQGNTESFLLYGRSLDAGQAVTLFGNHRNVTGAMSNYLVFVDDQALFEP